MAAVIGDSCSSTALPPPRWKRVRDSGVERWLPTSESLVDEGDRFSGVLALASES